MRGIKPKREEVDIRQQLGPAEEKIIKKYIL
jgi:hypothetical protein